MTEQMQRLLMNELKLLLDTRDVLVYSFNDVFIEIRMVRNDIAHEYLPEAIHDIFGKVLVLTPHLLDGVERTLAYCEKYTH